MAAILGGQDPCLVTRDELRLCELAYLSTLEAIEGSFARNEVSFAIVARQDSSLSEEMPSSPCSPAATSRTASPRCPVTTVNPATELLLGSPTVLPTASPEVQDGGGKGSPIELPTSRGDALARRRTVLDNRCHEHLVARGFDVLEL